MPSTYSPLLRFEEIGSGEQAGLWGDTTNKNLGELVEQAIAGVTTVSLSGTSDVTLSALDGALDQSRSAVLKFIGAPSGPINIIIPTSQKLYVARNETGQIIRIKTLAQSVGTAVELKDDEATLVFCDGADALRGIQTEGVGTLTVPGGGTGVTTFTAGFIKSPGGTGNLTSSATISLTAEVSNILPVINGGTGSSNTAYCNLTTNVNGILPIVNGGTGSTALTANGLLRENGAGAVSAFVGGANGQVATWNGSSWIAQLPAAGGVTSVFGRGGAVTAEVGDYSSFYVTLSTNQTITGQKTFSASSVADQRINVSFSGFSSGLSPTSLQLGVSSAGMYWNNSTQAVIIITPTFGENARFFGTGLNTQGNNSSTWQTVSDISIKTNLRPISDVLGKINALKPCHFEYKDKLGKTQTGFIAQEFATVFPGHTMNLPADDKYKEFLPEGQTDLTAIDANLIPYLVKAVQELSAKVDAQAAEIAALKAQ